MDQGYPLKPYATHYSSEVNWDESSLSPSWQRPYSKPTSSTVFNPASSRYERVGSGQDYSIDHSGNAYAGYEPSQPPAPKTLGFFSLLAWWLPEIAASLIAIISLLAIIAVLRVYDGQSLTQIDLPAGLNLNGIVAAISTVARVALMVPVSSALSQEAWVWFSNNARASQQCRSRLKDLDLSDNASRGAWGSLLFLFFARRRWVAYIGALITLLTLAFGTATQQLLAINPYSVILSNSTLAPTHLPRAETWQYYDANPAETSLTPPFSIRGAIYNGMFSSTIDPITVDCPTGNCTWPITPSLAICGECSLSSFVATCDQNLCNYTTPAGTNISLTNNHNNGIGYQVRPVSHGAIYNSSIGDRVYVSNFEAIGAPYMSLGTAFTNSNVTSNECALWFCIQSYSSVMVAGKLQQNVTKSFSNLTKPSYLVTGVFDNYTFAELPEDMNPDPAVTYNVSLIGTVPFADTFYDLFNGTAFVDLESSGASSDGVDVIWNSSSNLNAWIQNLATSLTNAIRYDDPNPYPASRASWWTPAPRRSTYDGIGYQLGYSVRWQWLLLPTACVAISILFLLTVMIKTARSSVAPWKSSLLTVLFFEADQELKERAIGRFHVHSGVSKAIGDTRAVLKEEYGGKWTFKSA